MNLLFRSLYWARFFRWKLFLQKSRVSRWKTCRKKKSWSM